MFFVARPLPIQFPGAPTKTVIPKKEFYDFRPSLEKLFQTNDKKEIKIYHAN
jgi:hypothetical protein